MRDGDMSSKSKPIEKPGRRPGCLVECIGPQPRFKKAEHRRVPLPGVV